MKAGRMFIEQQCCILDSLAFAASTLHVTTLNSHPPINCHAKRPFPSLPRVSNAAAMQATHPPFPHVTTTSTAITINQFQPLDRKSPTAWLSITSPAGAGVRLRGVGGKGEERKPTNKERSTFGAYGRHNGLDIGLCSNGSGSDNNNNNCVVETVSVEISKIEKRFR